MEENKYNDYIIHRTEGLEEIKKGMISKVEASNGVYLLYKDDVVRFSIPVEHVSYIELI